MFNKIVVLEPILITEEGKNDLKKYSTEVIFYDSKPDSENEIINRIGNADCILLSFTTKITKSILDRCNNIFSFHFPLNIFRPTSIGHWS